MRLGRQQGPAEKPKAHAHGALNNKQPTPRRQTQPITHDLDRIGNKPTKRARDTHTIKDRRHSFTLHFARVNVGNKDRIRGRKTGFKETQQESAGDDLVVVVAEPRTDGDGGPADGGKGEGAVGTKVFDEESPWDFDDAVGDEEEGADVVELCACEA